MARKRKLFTGVAPIGGHRVKSLREARRITSRFHQLNNEIGLIHPNPSEPEERMKKQRIEQEIEMLGGRDRYQQASVVTTTHHKTSKWVITSLRKLGVYGEKKDMKKKINTLEVGAINIQLQQYSGLTVRAIDINSQHPSIEELDFFDILPQGNFDLIVCSMVVNCISTPQLRGEMLARLSLHLTPLTGILCLVLPTRCVTSSITNDDSPFLLLLRSLNLVTPSANRFPHLDPSQTSPSELKELLLHSSPKLSFYILMHSSPSPTPLRHLSASQALRNWILDLPNNRRPSAADSDSEKNSIHLQEEEKGKGEGSTITENALRNLSSVLASLQNTFLARLPPHLVANDQKAALLSEEGLKLLLPSDKFPQESRPMGSVSGFVIHIPESLISLLLLSSAPPVDRPSRPRK